MGKQSDSASLSKGLRVWILASVFLLGLAVLVVEILGARVISPYYGSSVYAWSAQITVTLAALAAGYFFGGAWADARPSAALYFFQVTASGALVLLVPFLKTPLLELTTPLGLMGGSLASATLLFAPSLFVMSATGPLAIRLVTEEIPVLGRGVGRVYALSTVGSVLGALLTGFVLVPHFSVRFLFFSVGLGLILLGGVGLRMSGWKGGGFSAVLFAGLLSFPLLGPRAALQTNVIAHRSSFYGDVKVLNARPDMRYLILDGVTHGCIDPTTGESQSEYLWFLEGLTLLRPDARRALVIGLGAGILPESFRKHHGLTTDVVEIDPVVNEMAQKYFGFVPTGTVALQDGRRFVEKTQETYDIAVLDAFASEKAPFHLFTQEFFLRLKSRLSPHGIFAVNIISAPNGTAWHSVHKTLESVFPHVRVFSTDMDPERLGNLIIVASGDPLPDLDPSKARPALKPHSEKMKASEVPAPTGAQKDAALVLTDDYNPMDSLFRSVMNRWRQDILRLSRGILLYED